jgi:hypothetical protein
MFPLTAEVKCLHGNGKHAHGAEAVIAEATSAEDGGGWEDQLEGVGRLSERF